MFKVLVIGIAL